MSFVAVEVPTQIRANARPPKVSEAEVKELVKLLKAGKRECPRNCVGLSERDVHAFYPRDF